MDGWVLPDHGHALVVEMSGPDSGRRIAIQASHLTSGEACAECNAAVALLARLLEALSGGLFGIALGP